MLGCGFTALQRFVAAGLTVNTEIFYCCELLSAGTRPYFSTSAANPGVSASFLKAGICRACISDTSAPVPER